MMRYILILTFIVFSAIAKATSENTAFQIAKQEGIEKTIAPTKKFHRIPLKCNDDEEDIISTCESDDLELKLLYNFESDPNEFTLISSHYKKTVKMPDFFEGLGFETMAFKSDDESLVIILNQVYEYSMSLVQYEVILK